MKSGSILVMLGTVLFASQVTEPYVLGKSGDSE